MNDVLDDVVISRQDIRLPSAARADYSQYACAGEGVLRGEIEV